MGTVRSFERQLKAGLAALLIGVAAPVWCQPAPWVVDVGVLHQRYAESNMHLSGPGLYVGVERPSTAAQWWAPHSWHASAVAGQLAYGSARTGELSGVPWLQLHAGFRWRLPSWGGHTWRTGPTIDVQWTDLRGSSSTGHRGYERLGVRSWWGIDVNPVPEARLGAAVLLQGHQHSRLSQANSTLPDIVNRQTKGWWLQLELAPIDRWAQLQPWVEVKHIAESNKQGLQGWFEPENTQLQLGLRKRF